MSAESADIHQSEDTLCPSEPLTDAFHLKYSNFNEPFQCQNLKTHYKVTPYGDHGTDRVNPFSAMDNFRHHIIVNFTYFGVKELIEALISGC